MKNCVRNKYHAQCLIDIASTIVHCYPEIIMNCTSIYAVQGMYCKLVRIKEGTKVVGTKPVLSKLLSLLCPLLPSQTDIYPQG